MAIDPNIPLMSRPTDVASGLMQGFQIARNIRQSRLQEEQAQREAELQPLRQKILEAQVQAAPIAAETQRLVNLTAQQKLGVQGAALAAQRALPFIQSGDMAGLKTFIQGTNLLDDQDKSEMTAKIEANDLQGILGDVSGAIGMAQQMGIFAAPKEAADTRTNIEKNLEAAGFVPGTPQFQAAVIQQLAKPKGTQVTVTQGTPDLPAAVQTKINDLYDSSAKSELDSANYLDLANRIGATQFGPTGVFATVKDFFVDAVGGTDQETTLRKEFTRLRNSQVVKSLPAGPATDKDIAIFSEGFEKATANPERLQAFLRGAAKVQAIDSQIGAAKADWLTNNRSLSRAKEAFTSGDYDVAKGESFLDLQRRIVKSQNEIFSQQNMFPVTPQSPRPQQGMAIDQIGIQNMNLGLPGAQPAMVPPQISPAQSAPVSVPGFILRGSRPVQ